jgi:hypothetical protein
MEGALKHGGHNGAWGHEVRGGIGLWALLLFPFYFIRFFPFSFCPFPFLFVTST